MEFSSEVDWMRLEREKGRFWTRIMFFRLFVLIIFHDFGGLFILSAFMMILTLMAWRVVLNRFCFWRMGEDGWTILSAV